MSNTLLLRLSSKQNTMKNQLVLLVFSIIISIPLSTNAQVYEENFDTRIPADWFQYTEAGFDFVSWFGGEVNLFKQSSGDEILMFGTGQLDLSQYTKWDVDMYAFNLAFTSDTKPYIEMGILTDPTDISTFTPIKVEHVTNESARTYSVFLGAYNGMGHLVLKMVGERSQITYVDNWKLYDDDFEANFPLAVENMSVTPAADGGLSMTVQYTNPSFEADGDPLTTLDVVEFYINDEIVASQPNPVIGATESIEIPVDSSDFYTVTAIPFSNNLEGYSRESNVNWIGLDYPAAVQNLALTLNGNESTLTWESPTVGGNGGYFDGIVTEYLLTRCDGKLITVPGNRNTFSEELDMMGTVNYLVEPRNSSDIGDGATTNDIFYVSDDYLYYDNFWVDVVQSTSDPAAMGPNQWQSESTTNQAGWSYFTSNFTNTDPGEISYLWASQNQTDQVVRLVSPVINTSGSQNITIQLNSYLELSNAAYSFFLETTSDGGQNWTEIHEWSIDGNGINEITTKVVANSDVGSENFQMAITFKGNPAIPGFVRFDNIRVFDQPSIDLRVTDFDALATVEPGTEIPFIADIENNSTAVINCTVSCTVIERFGSNILYENEIEANDMAIGEMRNLDFGMWTSEEGEYIVDIAINYPGGDDNPDNDISSQELNVLQLVQRERVLMEDFTGTWCSYCPGAALGLKELMDAGYPISVIGRHREDDYETADIQDRMDQYEVFGFPTMIIDGVVKLSGGHQTESVAGLYVDDINARSSTLTPAYLEVSHSKLEGNTYNASVDVYSPSNILNPNYELRASIIESGIEDEWLGIPTVDEAQRYYSDNPIDLSNGSAKVDLSFTLEDVLDLNHVDMVLYVQDVSTNEVMNSTVIDINTLITSTQETLNSVEINISPNPASDFIEFNFDSFANKHRSIELINMLGQLVLRKSLTGQAKVRFDVSNVRAGNYFVRITDNNGIYTMKQVSIFR